MMIDENQCKTFIDYRDFATEFISCAMSNGVVGLIVSWKNAISICQLLNQYTIGGVSIAMRPEFLEAAYDDVQTQDGNMLITLFDSAEMICEKALDNPDAYVDDVLYFVEKSAEEVTLPLHAKIVPFKVKRDIFDEAF